MSKKKEKKKQKNLQDSDVKPLGLSPFLVTSNLKYYLGLSARALSVALCVFSFMYFILDTLDILTLTSNIALITVSLAFTFPIVFSMQNKWAMWLSLGVAAIIIGIHIPSFDFMNIVLVGTNLVDFTYDRLADMGFKYFINVSTGYGYIVDLETTVKYIVIALGLLISVIYSLSLGKKSHLIPPVILNVLVVAPSFICNILNTNWATAFIAVSYCTMAMLFVTDKLFSDMSNSKRFDTETVLNPSFVIGVDELTIEEKKQKKKEKAEKKKRDYVALDDELDDLIGNQKSRKKRSVQEQKAEKRKKRKEKRTLHLKKYAKSALAGFSALAMFFVGYVSMIIPATIVEKNFQKISLIDGGINEMREYITALLLGDDLTLDLNSFENYQKNFEPHSTDLTPRHYTGEKRFHVEVQRLMPVYLRGWIANEYKDGSWYLNTDNDVFKEYRNTFGVRTDTHEQLLDLFYKYMNPNTSKIENYLTQYSTQLKFGYVSMQVNVSRSFGGTTSLYVPAFIQSKYGLRSYKSVHEDEKMSYSNFFDGIYTSRNSKWGAKYAFVANVPTMKDENFGENISEIIAEFNIQADYLKYINSINPSKDPAYGYECLNPEAPAGMIVACKVTTGTTPMGYRFNVKMSIIGETVITVYGPYGDYVYTYDTSTGELLSATIQSPILDSSGKQYIYAPPALELAVRYFHVCTEEEREEIMYLINELDKYSGYVYNAYTEKADSEIITEFAKNFAAFMKSEKNSFSSDEYSSRHELILQIIDYMSQQYKYTLTPSSYGDENLTGVENFISVVKEGYCVQFASTLALVLREFGIPTRYVEGYIVSDYDKNTLYSSNIDNTIETMDTTLRYYANVIDSDEHAWVEVWYDGIGWVLYEATPPMTSLYYPGTSGETTNPDDPAVTEHETETNEETVDPVNPESSVTLPVETTEVNPEVTNETPKETTDTDITFIMHNFGKVIACIVPVLLIALLIFAEVERIKKGDKKRKEFVYNAKNATDQSEIKQFSSELANRIFEILDVFGLLPEENELPDQFRLRISRDLIRTHEQMKPKTELVEDYDAATSDEESASKEKLITDEEVMQTDEYFMVSAAIESLEAEEFGYGMNALEVESAANFYSELLMVRKKKAGFFKTILYRYILNKI